MFIEIHLLQIHEKIQIGLKNKLKSKRIYKLYMRKFSLFQKTLIKRIKLFRSQNDHFSYKWEEWDEIEEWTSVLLITSQLLQRVKLRWVNQRIIVKKHKHVHCPGCHLVIGILYKVTTARWCTRNRNVCWQFHIFSYSSSRILKSPATM